MFELPFGTFNTGDAIEVTYIPGFYKLGTGIKNVEKIAGTLAKVRTFQGRQYLVINLPKNQVLELKVEDLHNVRKTS